MFGARWISLSTLVRMLTNPEHCSWHFSRVRSCCVIVAGNVYAENLSVGQPIKLLAKLGFPSDVKNILVGDETPYKQSVPIHFLNLFNLVVWEKIIYNRIHDGIVTGTQDIRTNSIDGERKPEIVRKRDWQHGGFCTIRNSMGRRVSGVNHKRSSFKFEVFIPFLIDSSPHYHGNIGSHLLRSPFPEGFDTIHSGAGTNTNVLGCLLHC